MGRVDSFWARNKGQSFEELDVPVVQQEKEGGNYEYGEKNENKNSPPGEHYMTAHGTPIGGMADTLTTIGTVSFRSVLHYPGYITNPVVCAKTRAAWRYAFLPQPVHIPSAY